MCAAGTSPWRTSETRESSSAETLDHLAQAQRLMHRAVSRAPDDPRARGSLLRLQHDADPLYRELRHDRSWLDKIRPTLRANATLLHQEMNAPVPAVHAALLDEFFDRSYDLPQSGNSAHDAANGGHVPSLVPYSTGSGDVKEETMANKDQNTKKTAAKKPAQKTLKEKRAAKQAKK